MVYGGWKSKAHRAGRKEQGAESRERRAGRMRSAKSMARSRTALACAVLHLLKEENNGRRE